MVSIDGRRKYLHRYAWEKAYGPIPSGHYVDHINRDTSDCRLENLRLVTPQESALNVRGRSTLGKGVGTRMGKFRVQMRRGDVRIDRRFDTLQEAQAFSKEARANLHGEFACYE